MSDWTYSYHRFDDQAAAEAAIAALPGDGTLVAVDILGTLYGNGERTGTDPETGAALYARQPLPGWHVNLALRGIEPPPAWVASRTTPRTPCRLFA